MWYIVKLEDEDEVQVYDDADDQNICMDKTFLASMLR